MSTTASSLADAFEWYADWASDVSPLYERLARSVVEDPQLRDIVPETRPGQPAPNLLLGAVHALLLDGAEHPLRQYYPTCVPDPRPPADGDLVAAFRSFCQAHEQELRDIVSTRRVQTNDVGRAAVLLPAFTHVARRSQQVRPDTDGHDPLALVEIGSSAGLNLHWDRFRYEYSGRTCGDPDSPVEIRSEIRGDRQPPLPDSMPSVVSRTGIDLNPLDVTDDTDAHWLRALVVPDQTYRHDRLAAAIDLARSDPPPLVAGDALDVLPDVLADLPDDAACCVYSTITLYQFDDAAIDELEAILRDASRSRPVHWLSGVPDAPADDPRYRHVTFHDGERTERHIARYAAYGEWVEWLV